MKAFVIGATGFVGSHIAHRLIEGGYTVHGLCRDPRGDEKLRTMGVVPVRGDAEGEDILRRQAGDADVTVFAPQLLLEPEQKAVTALLDALEGTGKTFLFTSGTGVLARQTDGNWLEDTFAEDDPFEPYPPLTARVKTEQLVRTAGSERGVRAMVIRPPMIWGNGGCVIVSQLHHSLRKTGEVCYVGAGLNLYSNVHIQDLVEVFALAVARGVPGALYHAVSGEMNYRAMSELIALRAGARARSVSVGQAEEIWGKFFGRLVFSVCSRSRCPRTRRELGWSPRHFDVSEMLQLEAL
jgi:nucleoside-diphosphate-sugar epimerase